MKLLTIILILTMICTPANSAFQHSIDMSSGSRIGYTTNYGNTFGRSTQQTYSGTYNPSVNISSDQEYSQSSRAPRKSKGGGSSDGVTVTYETSWQGGLFHTTYSITYTYPDGHTEYETVDNWFGYFTIDAYAQEQAKKRAEQWAASHSVPIGDLDFYLITTLLFSYFIYNYMKKRRQQFLLYT